MIWLYNINTNKYLRVEITIENKKNAITTETSDEYDNIINNHNTDDEVEEDNTVISPGDHHSNIDTIYNIDWKNGIIMPEWVIEADSEEHPSELWILEITESGNPSGRISLDR